MGKWLDGSGRIPSKELAQLHSVKNGILRSACSTCPKMDAGFGKSVLMRIARLMNSLARSLNQNGDKIAVAILKNTRQLGCVCQDMEPPKSSSILRKSSNILKPIRCAQFTKAVLRHANIRDQKPSLGIFAHVILISATPTLQNFEDRSKEETERQERDAREAAWKMARCILKLKEKNKAAFFSPSENRCLPASTIKPEEREFVVGSGASMHMIDKKDLNSAELETVTTSRSPMTEKKPTVKCRRMKRLQFLSEGWKNS